VERIADDGELEVLRFSVEGLGGRHDRPDIPCAYGGRLGPDHLRHVRFGVHGLYLAEPLAQRERELADPASQIQQAPPPRDLGGPDQIRDHRLRMGQPVPVIVPRGPPVEIRREPHRRSHLLLTPVAAGSGQHLFEEIDGAPQLSLADVRRFASGVLVLIYTPRAGEDGLAN
jgi:hypothetical protein